MLLAVAGAGQLWIVSATFINPVPTKIGNPSFDSPSGNKDRHHVIKCPGLDALLLAFVIELTDTPLDAQAVSVDHHGKAVLNIVPATAVFPEFLREAGTHMFRNRPAAPTTILKPCPLVQPL